MEELNYSLTRDVEASILSWALSPWSEISFVDVKNR